MMVNSRRSRWRYRVEGWQATYWVYMLLDNMMREGATAVVAAHLLTMMLALMIVMTSRVAADRRRVYHHTRFPLVVNVYFIV